MMPLYEIAQNLRSRATERELAAMRLFAAARREEHIDGKELLRLDREAKQLKKAAEACEVRS